jgi:hypothetical protein
MRLNLMTMKLCNIFVLLWAKTNTTQENKEPIIYPSNNAGLQANAEKNKYMFMSLQCKIKNILKTDSKGKVDPVLFYNLAQRYEGVLGSGSIAPRVLGLGIRWR